VCRPAKDRSNAPETVAAVEPSTTRVRPRTVEKPPRREADDIATAAAPRSGMEVNKSGTDAEDA